MLLMVSRIAAGLGVLLLVEILIHAPAPTTPCIRIAVAVVVLIIVALAGVATVTRHVVASLDLASPGIGAAPSVRQSPLLAPHLRYGMSLGVIDSCRSLVG